MAFFRFCGSFYNHKIWKAFQKSSVDCCIFILQRLYNLNKVTVSLILCVINTTSNEWIRNEYFVAKESKYAIKHLQTVLNNWYNELAHHFNISTTNRYIVINVFKIWKKKISKTFHVARGYVILRIFKSLLSWILNWHLLAKL